MTALVGQLSGNLTTLFGAKPDYWSEMPDGSFLATVQEQGTPGTADFISFFVEPSPSGEQPAYAIRIMPGLPRRPSMPGARSFLWRQGDRAVATYGGTLASLVEQAGLLLRDDALPATLAEMQNLVALTDPQNCKLYSPGTIRMAARKLLRLAGIRRLPGLTAA